MTRFRPLTFSHRAYFTLEDIQEAVSSRSLKMSSFGKHYFTYKWGLIYNQTALGTALNSATPQWIRHSVVTGEQQLIGPNFPALRHNWFSRLHFRFSCLSTTELPEISRCAHSNLNSLTLTFQQLSVVRIVPIPQISRKSNHNFFSYLAKRQAAMTTVYSQKRRR